MIEVSLLRFIRNTCSLTESKVVSFLVLGAPCSLHHSSVHGTPAELDMYAHAHTHTLPPSLSHLLILRQREVMCYQWLCIQPVKRVPLSLGINWPQRHIRTVHLFYRRAIHSGCGVGVVSHVLVHDPLNLLPSVEDLPTMYCFQCQRFKYDIFQWLLHMYGLLKGVPERGEGEGER